MAAEATELRDHRVLRKPGERAQRLKPEQAQPAIRVGIERQHADRLGGEKLRLPSHRHYYRVSRFCAGCGDPGDELSDAPPHPKYGMRSAECGVYAGGS